MVPPTSWHGYLPQNKQTKPGGAFLYFRFDPYSFTEVQIVCNKLHNQHGSPKRQGALPSTPEATDLSPSVPAEFGGQIPTLISGTFYK